MNNWFMNNPMVLQWLAQRQQSMNQQPQMMQMPQQGLFNSMLAQKQPFQPVPQITNPIRQPLPVPGMAQQGGPVRQPLPVPVNTMPMPQRSQLPIIGNQGRLPDFNQSWNNFRQNIK